MESTRPFPGFWQAVGIIGFIFGLQLVFGLALFLFGITKPAAIHLAVANFISIALGIALGLSLARQTFRDTFPLSPVAISTLFPTIIAILGSTILLSEADNLLRAVLPPPQWLIELFESLASGEDGMFGSILALVIVAPLTEEFLFRGLILKGFLQRYSATTAILASSFLFGAMHANPWQFVGAFALGSLFAWLYIKTRSLFLPILGHALHNGLPLLIINMNLDISGFSTEYSEAVEFQPWWLDATGALLIVGGLLMLHTMFKRNL